MDILISGIIFLCVCILHSLIHRIFLKFQIISFKTMLLYPVGFGVLLYLIANDVISTMPITSIYLYIFLSCYVALMYITPYLGTKMPSSIILDELLVHKKMKKSQLLQLFTEEELIDKRIDDLVNHGYLTRCTNSDSRLKNKEKRDRLLVTGKGMILYRLIRVYEILFHWKVGG